MAFSIAMLLLGLAGPAQDNAAPPAEQKKICRRIVDTGSIMGKRVCHTAAEWKQIDDASSRGVDSFRDRSTQGMPRG